MLRTLAFVENDMYVRNFITSGAFDLLHNTPFKIVTSEVVDKLKDSIPPERFAGRYERSLKNRNIIRQFNKVSLMANREKSTTFDIKVNANAFGEYTLEEKLMANARDFTLTREIFVRGLEVNPSLEQILTLHRPQVVLFPFTGVESTGAELVMLSQKYQYKTFFLVNGWDNLCSKGVFLVQPDFLGVWGLQSFIDAVSIQGMKHHQCFLLGCARYEDYFKRENIREKLFPFRYILFAGATTACDEITPLRLLEESLEELGQGDIKVLYRPHPWREKRKCFDVFEPDKFKHVMLDPQVADNYFNEKSKGTEGVSSQNYPELKYYPSLLNHALFAISPMSSMTLEAGLFDVPTMILANDDGEAIPPSLQANYQHFEGADSVPGWFMIRTLDELKPKFKVLLGKLKDDNPEKRLFRPMLSLAMRKYLFQDDRNYVQRLFDAVQVIQAGFGLR